jgi:hypothetical protein
MSWLNGEFHDGWTSSSYAGHGILFQNLPTEGDQGGSPLLDDGGANGDEIRWGPATVTSGAIAVTLFEDGSFESTGGAGGFSYTWWRNGVAQDDQAVIISSADAIDATVSFTMPQFAVAVIAEATAPGNSATINFAMPQFSVAATASTTAPVIDATVSFTMPQFSVAVSAETESPTSGATVSFTMPQFTVAVSAESTVPEISATVAFTMPQFSVQVFSGEFDYYNAQGSTITYLAESTEITYTNESTQIEWRA